MITLYQFARTWSIPNLSHFCTKLETYLRINKLPYEIVETLPIKAPRGKLPYIEDQGRKLSDTRMIINYLKASYGNNDKALLSPEQQGIAKAYQRLLEEHMYWVSMYTRWNFTEENWQTNKKAMADFRRLPVTLRRHFIE
jgi:glutathione S-transferase